MFAGPDLRYTSLQERVLAQSCKPLCVQLVRLLAPGICRNTLWSLSDYAVKMINLKYPDDISAVRAERKWQIMMIR